MHDKIYKQYIGKPVIVRERGYAIHLMLCDFVRTPVLDDPYIIKNLTKDMVNSEGREYGPCPTCRQHAPKLLKEIMDEEERIKQRVNR